MTPVPLAAGGSTGTASATDCFACVLERLFADAGPPGSVDDHAPSEAIDTSAPGDPADFGEVLDALLGPPTAPAGPADPQADFPENSLAEDTNPTQQWVPPGLVTADLMAPPTLLPLEAGSVPGRADIEAHGAGVADWQWRNVEASGLVARGNGWPIPASDQKPAAAVPLKLPEGMPEPESGAAVLGPLVRELPPLPPARPQLPVVAAAGTPPAGPGTGEPWADVDLPAGSMQPSASTSMSRTAEPLLLLPAHGADHHGRWPSGGRGGADQADAAGWLLLPFDGVRYPPAAASQAPVWVGPGLARQAAEAIHSHVEAVFEDGHAEFQLQVEPPELGVLKIYLTGMGERLTARLVAVEETAHRLLEQQADALRERLERSGLVLDRLEIRWEGGGRSHKHDDAPPEPWPVFEPSQSLSGPRSVSSARSAALDILA